MQLPPYAIGSDKQSDIGVVALPQRRMMLPEENLLWMINDFDYAVGVVIVVVVDIIGRKQSGKVCFLIFVDVRRMGVLGTTGIVATWQPLSEDLGLIFLPRNPTKRMEIRYTYSRHK